jgi:integrase
MQFVRYCHDHFKMQNLRNLHDKHLAAFIKSRQEGGIAAKTIKNDLAAIRYLHDQVQQPRYLLSDNKRLQQEYSMTLAKTPQVNGDRAWTDKEYRDMKVIALEYAQKDVADCMTLARTMGLRVTEAAAVSRTQAEQALRTGIYQVKGEAKNGKHRQVPLSPEGRRVFENRLTNTPRGARLFVRPGDKTHQVVNRMEKFLEYHREKVVTSEGIEKRIDTRDGSQRPLTFHGLRYSYVQQRMEEEMGKRFTEAQAALIVSREVGHERINVIAIYRG